MSTTLYSRYRLDAEVAFPTHGRPASDGLEDGRFWVQLEARY
jgi:hypothetical protein